VSPTTNESCADVLELSKLNLQLAFVGAGTLSKNIEDQSRSSDHPTLQVGLEVALLTGEKRVVKNNELSLRVGDFLRNLLQLALANKVLGGG